jgi:hypothetical protein
VPETSSGDTRAGERFETLCATTRGPGKRDDASIAAARGSRILPQQHCGHGEQGLDQLHYRHGALRVVFVVTSARVL